MKVQVIGIPWFSRDDFARLRAMFTDGDKLHRTYDEWLTAAKKTRHSIMAQGTRVVRAKIDPDTFPAWCAANGHDLDAKGRVAFADRCAFETLGKSC